eukprot:g49791.t1
MGWMWVKFVSATQLNSTPLYSIAHVVCVAEFCIYCLDARFLHSQFWLPRRSDTDTSYTKTHSSRSIRAGGNQGPRN